MQDRCTCVYFFMLLLSFVDEKHTPFVLSMTHTIGTCVAGVWSLPVSCFQVSCFHKQQNVESSFYQSETFHDDLGNETERMHLHVCAVGCFTTHNVHMHEICSTLPYSIHVHVLGCCVLRYISTNNFQLLQTRPGPWLTGKGEFQGMDYEV